MLINNKQDLFYSLSLTPNSQEYFNLPIPAEASGFRMVVTGINATNGGVTANVPASDPKFGIINSNTEGSGWESLFEQFRVEDSSRSTNDVVFDFRGSEDFGYFTEGLLLASPLPAEEYAIRSKMHVDVYTGSMGNPRMFVKTAADLSSVCDAALGTINSITINFMALIGPALPPQSIRCYHVGEATDNNIEYVYPTGNSPRSVVYTETARNIADVYSNGQHLTSVPESMITDYNVLRNIENNASFDADMNDKAYLNVGSLAGQRIRYEQTAPGKLHIVAIYTEA